MEKCPWPKPRGRDDRVWNDRGKPTSMFAGLCTFKRNQSTNYRLAYFSPFQPMGDQERLLICQPTNTISLKKLKMAALRCRPKVRSRHASAASNNQEEAIASVKELNPNDHSDSREGRQRRIRRLDKWRTGNEPGAVRI
jgi:hypothetical protein